MASCGRATAYELVRQPCHACPREVERWIRVWIFACLHREILGRKRGMHLAALQKILRIHMQQWSNISGHS